MKFLECEFEADVLAAALQSHWPEQTDASLRAHVAACPVCSAVVAIAGSMEEAREEMRTQTRIPESGRVWWLAQLRAQREAAKAAGRPITAAQVIAFACAAGLLGACFGATSTWFQSVLAKLSATAAGLRIAELLPPAAAMITGYGFWLLAVGAVLLLIPTAIYLAFLRD